MRHFLFLIGIALIVVSCNSGKNQSSTKANDSSLSTSTASKHQSTDEWTLNGYTKADAGKMVNAFLKNKGVYNKAARTNIWFSRQYLEKLITMLEKEKAIDKSHPNADTVDGVRVYYAKEAPNKYGFVLVSTRCKLTDPKIHYDYFDHNDPYFKSSQAMGEVDRYVAGRPGTGNHPGALMYNVNYKCKGDNCNPKATHYVTCDSAFEWVKNHVQHSRGGIKDTINTTSEWFELSLLNDLKNDIDLAIQTGRKADGMRIYYARKNHREVKYPNIIRHNLIIVTTEIFKGQPRQDYFDCPHKWYQADDNGEQCREQCSGTSWTDVKSVD